VNDVLCGIGQRKAVGAGEDAFGIGGQIKIDCLRRGVGRQADAADPRRHNAIATLDASRERIGVEVGVQLIDTQYRQGAIGSDVLPAIGRRRSDIGRSSRVTDEGAGLEQVGTPASAIGDAEIRAAACERKAGNDLRGEPVIDADGDATESARGRV
jgi:hypothetical protein